MRRMLAFFGGLLSGSAIGTAVVLLFTPASGDALRGGLREHVNRAVRAGQDAAAQKRLEMESQLIDMTGPHPPGSPMASVNGHDQR